MPTRRFLGLASILLALACGAPAEDAAHTTATATSTTTSKPGAPALGATDAVADSIVTVDNLQRHEAAWPAIVALVDDWQPAGAEAPLKAGFRGALVRVNADGRPRIDFGRHGKHDVPAARTDVVFQANAVLDGTQFKAMPNFIRQIGTRLVIADRGDRADRADRADRGDRADLRPLASAEVARSKRFLCVFADPSATDFPDLVERLEPLIAGQGIQPIFFPQDVGRGDLQALVERLDALSWRAPFTYPHLTADYTQSILGVDSVLPALLLLSDEGRVLFRAEGEGVFDSDGFLASLRS